MTEIAKTNFETLELNHESHELVMGAPEGYITIEEGVNYFWEQLEEKFGYDIRKTKK